MAMVKSLYSATGMWRILTRLAVLLHAFAVIPSNAQTTSSGTGFFISPGGIVATSYHVIDGYSSIAVRDSQGVSHRARLILKDSANDLALLKIDSGAFPFVPIRRSSEVRKGEEVFVIGFPNIFIQGSEAKVTQGIVSALSGIAGEPNSFQMSAAVQPGNSGGPLFDRFGNAIGVVSAKLISTTAQRASGIAPEGVNYAVKSNYLIELANTAGIPIGKIVAVGKGSLPESLAGAVARAERSTVIVLAQTSAIAPRTDSSAITPPPRALPPQLPPVPRPTDNANAKACASNLDCPGTQACVSNRCVVRKSAGSSCVFTEECDISLHCVNSSCGVRPTMGGACDRDGDCDTGLFCTNGSCARPKIF